MTATIGTIGYGSSVQVDDGTSNAFVDFVEVTQITVPSQEAQTVESTNLASPNRTREYVSALVEPGEFNFVQRWSKTAYARALALKGATHNYKVKWPDTSSAAFAGILTKCETEVGVDAVVDIKVSVKVTGQVTFTPAA